MHQKAAQILWMDLLNCLGESNHCNLSSLVKAVQVWVSSNIDRFGSQAELYGLTELSKLKADDFPVDQSRLIAEEEVRVLRAIQPSTVETFAARIRDLLWGALVYQTHYRCPQCDDDYLRALWSDEQKEIVLACDTCAYSRLRTGGGLKDSSTTVRPMTSKELLDNGVLLPIRA